MPQGIHLGSPLLLVLFFRSSFRNGSAPCAFCQGARCLRPSAGAKPGLREVQSGLWKRPPGSVSAGPPTQVLPRACPATTVKARASGTAAHSEPKLGWMLQELHIFGADVDLATTKGKYHPFQNLPRGCLKRSKGFCSYTAPGGGGQPLHGRLDPHRAGFLLAGLRAGVSAQWDLNQCGNLAAIVTWSSQFLLLRKRHQKQMEMSDWMRPHLSATTLEKPTY